MTKQLTSAENETNKKTLEHINEVRAAIVVMMEELEQRATVHDQSKLERPEVEIFTKYTPKLAGCTYGSDEYKRYLEEMKPALDHHYFNNRHHPEYWCFEANGDYYPEHLENGNAVGSMNLIDVLEMVCDWYAAGKRHNDGDIMKSIEINEKRFGLSPQLVSILKNTARLLERR